jgi:hypothetical protein
MAADWETFANLFAEIGMHPVQEPDVLREAYRAILTGEPLGKERNMILSGGST